MKWALIVVLFLCVDGCGGNGPAAHRTTTEADYKATIHSARDVVPVAVQMETLFVKADHFITHYGFGPGPKTWNTEVFFGGRYSLTMQVDVEIDNVENKITAIVGDPAFILLEYEKVELLPDGRADTTYRSQKQFTAVEWKKLYEAKGDFSVIGVTINPRPVKNFDEEVAQVRRDRVSVRLLE